MSEGRPREHHDEQLGAALRELHVPEHGADFHAELDQRLDEWTNQVAARRVRLRWGLRVAAVAATAVVVLFFVGLPRDERVPEIAQRQVATAAQVKAKVRTALARVESLSGILVSDGPGKGDEHRQRFVLTDDGDFRLTGITLVQNVAYDASAGVERSLNPSSSIGGDTLFAAERSGLAPGPPDPGPLSSWALPREFAAVVRALLAARDPRVREITYDDRRAWRLDIPAVPNALVPEFSGDRFEITVDRQTAIPVRIVETKNGTFLRELRIDELAVDEELPPGTFTLEFPPGTEVSRTDAGFRRVELDAVAAAVGYVPLVAAWTPEGYELTEVAVASRANPTGAEAANPASEQVVSLSYRRGLDQFLVTTRLARGGTWSDPLATGEGFRDSPERITIRSGALAGEAAELLIVPRGIPHVWALSDELVVTVGGDLSRAELVRITESLAKKR